jgi:hypothetical protein
LQLNESINSTPAEFNNIIASLFKFIKIKLKDFKENNFNVLREAFAVLESLTEKCSGLTRKYANILIKTPPI